MRAFAGAAIPALRRIRKRGKSSKVPIVLDLGGVNLNDITTAA